MKFSADKIYYNFFSGESKDYKYVKFPTDVSGTLTLTDGMFFEYLEASKSSKRTYTQFTLTLCIRGFFLRQNQS